MKRVAIFLCFLFFISCKKDGPTTPQLSSTTVSLDKSNNSVSLTAKVISEGGSATKERGFCWGTSPNPSVSDAKVSNQYGIGEYSYTISNLQLSTTYYVRAFATNAIGTSYGSEVTFKSLSLGKVTTSTPIEITNVGAKTSITIDDFGDAIIKKIGAVCSTKQNATITTDSTTFSNSNNTDKTFNITLDKLQQNTIYYVRGFVQSGAGVGYGNEVSFKTNGVPTLTANAVSAITQTSALLSGDVSSDGGDLISEIGVCLSKSQNPTINDLSFKASNLNMNKYSVSATGLTGNTTYYVRGYAKNKYGTNYSPQTSFLSGPVLATISSTAFSSASIYSNKATYGATITNNGGASVTEIGIVASLKSNPTISNLVFSTTTVSNIFSIQMTGLTNDTIYYAKPYVKNSVGITYGEEISFRTGYKVGIETGPAGGLIIYSKPVRTNGWRFIEAYAEDMPVSSFPASTDPADFVYLVKTVNFSCLQDLNTGNEYGDGFENTIKLNSVCGSDEKSAAIYCSNLKKSTFDDWYLPNKLELKKVMELTGKLSNSIYISSSVTTINGVTNYYALNMSLFESPWNSGVYGKVRPVRRF
jgi:hypothetical protein